MDHRLVGDHHRGIAGKGTRDADALLMAARELARAAIVEVPGEFDRVQQLHDHLVDFIFSTRRTRSMLLRNDIAGKIHAAE